MICNQVDPLLSTSFNVSDGEFVNKNTSIGTIKGSIQSILKLERLLLNCMQRMSGIATKTNYFAKLIAPFNVKLLDTRKTTPNFRVCEKWAVKIGGGVNHRFGLYDLIMLKDNHIDYAGGIKQAIEKANEYVYTNNLSLKIEVETRTLADVETVCKVGEGKVFRIMLDNFTPSLIEEALQIIDKKFETEASGGIHLGNIQNYAATGVDYISVGGLIHQAQSVDLSLKADLA
jgi:nicotinate-nucleotide pyrophosphorylase (carboxylating)